MREEHRGTEHQDARSRAGTRFRGVRVAAVREHTNQGITVALHGLIMRMRHNQSVIRPVLCVCIHLKRRRADKMA